VIPQQRANSKPFSHSVLLGAACGFHPKHSKGFGDILGIFQLAVTCSAAEPTGGGTTAPNAVTACFDLN
jgi:hypothetical protein